jgi:hypothetical protein
MTSNDRALTATELAEPQLTLGSDGSPLNGQHRKHRHHRFLSEVSLAERIAFGGLAATVWALRKKAEEGDVKAAEALLKFCLGRDYNPEERATEDKTQIRYTVTFHTIHREQQQDPLDNAIPIPRQTTQEEAEAEEEA